MLHHSWPRRLCPTRWRRGAAFNGCCAQARLLHDIVRHVARSSCQRWRSRLDRPSVRSNRSSTSGTTRRGPLEVMTVALANGDELVIHAMGARQKYYNDYPKVTHRGRSGREPGRVINEDDAQRVAASFDDGEATQLAVVTAPVSRSRWLRPSGAR